MKHILTLTIILAVSASAFAQEAATQPAGKEGVALTVYNGNFAVVRDTRKLEIKDGMAYFKDVAQQIDPTTVHFKSFTDPAATLMEQNYQFDLVSADKLLQKYLDKPLEVVAGKGEKTTTYAGTLMSFDAGQLVLKEKDGQIVMVQRADNVRDIRFSALPEGLLTQPTLVWQIKTAQAGAQLVEVSYQTAGMNWHSEYVMVLNGDDTSADLNGWVSVENRSGKTFKDAMMKFVAGDVRKVANAPRREEPRGGSAKGGDMGNAMEEQAFFEYHMYTMPRPSTVADNEVKQLELFTPASGIAVKKQYLMFANENVRWYGGPNTNQQYGVGEKLKAKVFVEFKNSKENHMGLPLPAGKIRVYKMDPKDKAMEFIGEEMIDHTPVNENLSLNIGNAFDIVGERKQTKFEVDNSRREMTESIEITIRNSKKEAIVVRVKEGLIRSNQSKITENSHPQQYKQLDAFTAAWDLPVPAGTDEKQGTVTLKFTVEYRW